jgi:hypothetical protein
VLSIKNQDPGSKTHEKRYGSGESFRAKSLAKGPRRNRVAGGPYIGEVGLLLVGELESDDARPKTSSTACRPNPD